MDARDQPRCGDCGRGQVGGIGFNNAYPVDFLADNLAIALNVIRALARGRRLLFLGSSCIYPRLAALPMREEMLLTGSLEPTNEWYRLAEIAAIKLVEAYRRQYGVDFISVMPTNLYAVDDLAAIIRPLKVMSRCKCGWCRWASDERTRARNAMQRE
jgi:GDP-L-fucose synthase